MERFLPRLRMPLAGLWTTLLFLFVSLAAMAQRPFITTWQTTAANESITIPVNPDVSGYNYTVDWGDGNTSTGQTGDAIHTYTAAGTYTVSISGSFPAIKLSEFGIEVSDKLVSIEQWGDMAWQSMEGAFSGASNMVLNATDVPNLSGVSSLARMFDGASSLNSNLNGWNVSTITDMSLMFNMASTFNGDISSWNVSNVTNMYGMFWYAADFNQDIGGWNVSQVADMSYMFYSAADFNQDLSAWSVSSVKSMIRMFAFALGFDQSLGSWDISSVTDMAGIFTAISNLSPENYSAMLIGWAPRSVQSGVVLDAPNLTYCPGTDVANAIQQLESKGWAINDAGVATDCSGGGMAGAFVTTWQTTTTNESITIPVNPGVTGYNYTVDWGDGTPATNHTDNATHTYANAGTYTVSITGDFPAIQFGSASSDYDNDLKLRTVEQWGDQVWQGMDAAFYGCANLVTVSSADAPDFAPGSTLFQMFRGCSAFNANLNHWDLSNVRETSYMFYGASSFNGEIGGWDVSNVTVMQSMFFGATAFNGAIAGWDVSSVTHMDSMFGNATAFNREIGSWDVSNVRFMDRMFFGATAFDGNIESWDVSSVTAMGSMFEGASAFNRDLDSWNVSSVAIMRYMFSGATAFNRSLANWDVAAVTTMVDMLDNSGMSPENYDATLIGWAAQDGLQNGVSLGANGLTYCEGAEARQQLIDDFEWTITDDREADDCDGGGIDPADPNHFITIWKTDNDGPSGDDQITIPAGGEFTYTWVDTNNPASTGSGSGNDGTTITFPQAGTYEIRIAPTGSSPFNGIQFAAFVSGDKLKLLEIKNWGGIHWSEFAFGGCTNLSVTATDIPDLSGVTDLSFAFSYSGIDEIPNFNDWDVSNVTNMGNLFEQATNFNQPLDRWDVSNVIDMRFMFDGATSFNQPLDSWDVRKLEHFDYMFRDASSFNQSLGAWKLESLGGAVAAFFRSGMSCENFSYTLYGWAINPITNEEVVFGPHGIPYSPDVATYRDFLINNLNWNFQGSDPVGTCSVTLPSTPVTPGPGNILYVDQNVSGGNGSGDSWENAIPELADALKWAREQYDGGSPGWDGSDPLKIFVAKGVYKPLYNAADGAYTTDGDRDNSFVLVPDVQLYGGFDPPAGIETLEDARILPAMNSLEQGSILSGDFDGNDNTANYDNHTENAHHVTIASGNVGSALMDGFTVTGGYAYGNTSGPSVMGRTIYRFFGGGTYVVTSSPQFTHMAWFNNLGDWGGGLFNTVSLLTETSAPRLSNVTFYRNMAPGGGGGIRNFGGSIDIKQAIFANNGAGLVEDGTSSGPGGGIHSSGEGTSLSVTNATFYGNWIVGVFIPQFDGGAIYVEQTSTLLNNVVIWENEVEGDPADPSASISVSTLGGDVTVANSLVAHTGGSANWNHAMGILDGGNNIDTDPVFVSTTPGDAGYLQLSACSPAISTGSNQLYIDAGGDLADDLDMGGNPRVYDFVGDGVIDMGAYEYQGERIYIEQLTMPDAVQVVYGTEMGDIEGLPTTVAARLSDETDVSIPLDGNLANWTLASPAGGTYDGDVAGTYVFTVPLLIPETECYLNPENLAAEVTIMVAKGTPVLTAAWNGTAIDADEGLSLMYGNVGELAFSTTDTDGELVYAFGDDDVQVLDLADFDAVAAQQAGIATLAIAQEETDNFEAAAIEITVTVLQKPITIVAAADQGKVYGAAEPSTYGYALAEGDALAFDEALTDIVSAAVRQEGEGVGVYDIELAFNGAQAGNYAITFEADNDAFVITPLEIAVTAESQTKVFGTDDPALAYTYTPELIGDDVFAGGLEREGGDDVGSYLITQGDLSLSDNYEITFEEGTLTITRADIGDIEGIVFEDASSEYDGTEHVLALSGELPEEVTVTYEIDGEAGNGATDVGTYEVKALIDGGNNYKDTELTATLSITPLEITVTAADKSKAFGSDDPALTYTFTPELIGDDTFSGELDREEGVNVGSYAITQGNLSLDDNYEITFEGGTLTIATADYEGIEFNNASFGYDGTEHTLELTGELPEGASVRYEIDGEPGNSATDAGTYAVIAIIDGGANYRDVELTATLTITPLEVTVTATDKTKVFGADDPAFTYTFIPELVGDDAFSGNLARAEGETVGDYAIMQGDLSLGDNYEITFEAGKLTITQQQVTGIAFNSISSTYDGTEQRLILAGELPAGASVTYEIDGKPGNRATDAGMYDVTAYIDGGQNYEDDELTATLTIAPLEITVAVADKAKAFGTDDPALTYTFTPGLIGDDVFAGDLNRDGGEDVGDYAITQGDLSLDDNYTLVFEAGTLTITPRQITGLVFENTSFTYDGTEHTLSLAGDLPAGASVTYENNGRVHVGRQTVKALISGDGNYQDQVLEAILTVLPAIRTLDFPALPEKIYGDAAFDAGATATSGEEIIYISSNPDVAEVTAEGEITIIGAGETTITATVPENANYGNRPQEHQTLTVRKARQTITLNGPAEVDRDAGSIALTASSTSGLPVVLTSDNAEVATLGGTSLNILRLGRVTITATQMGDANHEAAEPVTLTIRVVDPTSDLPVRVHPVISPNGDGVNEFLMIEAIADYPQNRVTIFNRNGTLLWEANGYDNNRVAFRGVSTGQQLLPAGTYFYIVEVKDGNSWKHKKGWFVLRY